jgi:hypothetical protein
MAENAARNFAQRATAYTADTIEKSKTTAEEATRIMQHSYVTASKAAVDFNLKLPPWLKKHTSTLLNLSRSEFPNIEPAFRAPDDRYIATHLALYPPLPHSG